MNLKAGKIFLGTAVIVVILVVSAAIFTKLGKSPAGTVSSQNLAGHVALISSGELYIKDEKSDRLRSMRPNDQLHIGDTVIVGRGVSATLKLTRPKGVSEDTELVFIKPLPGEEYTVTVELQHKDDGSVEAAISS